MLFAKKVIVYPLLGVADDQESSADVAHLHGLLDGRELPRVGGALHQVDPQHVTLLLELITQFHQALGLLDVAAVAGHLGLGDEGADLLAQQDHLLIHLLVLAAGDPEAAGLQLGLLLLLRQDQPLLGLLDPGLQVGEHLLAEAQELVQVLALLVGLLLVLELGLQVVVVNLAARAEVGLGVDKEIVGAKLN